jgi:hypothetical protein
MLEYPKIMKRTWIAVAALATAVALHTATADPYQNLIKYKTGDSRACQVAIENEITATKPAGYPAIEAKLLAVLQAADATEDAKTFACRGLRLVGSAKCVPVVAPLLGDEKLSHMARWVLQGNPSDEAGKALRNALGTTKGKQLVGVIGSVGARRDADAVGALASLAKNDDAVIAGAAMSALGHTGGAASAKALDAVTPSAALQKVWVEAELACAESLAKKDAAASEKMCRHIYNGQFDSVCRVAALAGLARLGAAQGKELVAALKGNDAKLQIEAAQLSRELKDAASVEAYVAAAPSLPASLQVIVLSGFAASGNKAAAPVAVALAESADAEVSAAALKALGVIGNVSNVPLLVKLSLANNANAALAFTSLSRLPGADVDAALSKLLKSPNAGERTKAVEAFAARMDRKHAGAILAACEDAEKDVRMAAYKALRVLADETMLAAVAIRMTNASSGSERSELEQTTTAVALRCADADAVANVLSVKLGQSTEADASLLTVLAKRGGAKALETVRNCVAGTNPEQKKAAVRAMSSWADTTPLPDLLKISQDDADAACRALALRGYVRLVGDSDKPAAEKVKMFESALATAKSPDAMKQILSGLGGVKEIVSLKVVAAQLGNAAVANEAAAAALAISNDLVGGKRKSKDKAIVDALTKIEENAAVNEGLRKQAAELLKKLPQQNAKKKN